MKPIEATEKGSDGIEISVGSLLDSLAETGGRLRYLEDEGRFSVTGLATRDLGAVLRIGRLLEELAPDLSRRRSELEAEGFLTIERRPVRRRKRRPARKWEGGKPPEPDPDRWTPYADN